MKYERRLFSNEAASTSICLPCRWDDTVTAALLFPTGAWLPESFLPREKPFAVFVSCYQDQKPAKLFWGLYEVGCFSNFTHDSSLYSYCYCLLFARFNASAVNRWSNLRFASFSRCIFLVSFNLLLLFHLNNLMAFWFRFWFPCRHQPLWMEPGEVSGQLRGLER